MLTYRGTGAVLTWNRSGYSSTFADFLAPQVELQIDTLLTDSHTAITHIFIFSKVYLLVFSVKKDVL